MDTVVATEVAYWLQNKDGQTPASTTLNPDFLVLLHPGQLFLDVGSGYGRISRQLDDFGLRVIGIDPNLQELSVGKNQNPSIPIAQAYGEHIPFRDNSFNGAVILGVLGGVDRNTRCEILAETIRCVKPEGLVYAAEFSLISDPNSKTIADNQRWIDIYPRDSYQTGEFGSVIVHDSSGGTKFIAHHFTEDELNDLLTSSGIRHTEVRKVPVKSVVSGSTRDTWNIWGQKAA